MVDLRFHLLNFRSAIFYPFTFSYNLLCFISVCYAGAVLSGNFRFILLRGNPEPAGCFFSIQILHSLTFRMVRCILRN